ncbi:MAG: Na+:solute symporter [Bacteroidetes bacterium]|nr:Na+:solute symporter [Bacteroidota bacterium]
MQYHFIDIAIIILYLVLTIFIGFYISKRASKNLEAYFLGGKSLPWYVLGVSNASGMFDITGTMWLVGLLFVYGLKSLWIPWLWPVFNQIFLMVYLSIWLRRSNVLTGAEWIRTRFGKGKGAELSHIIVIVFALVSVIGFLAYGFKGIGKFSATFLPWVLSEDPTMNANLYALIFMGITTLYVVKGGMFSVVFTEVLQFVVMTVASIAVGVIALQQVSPELLASHIPEGWGNIFFGWNLDLDWSGIMDSVNGKIEDDGWSMFGFFFMMMLFKGILISAAGPAPNYDMQRILSTKSPKEAAKMSFFVNIALFFPRYLMIGGLAVLALVYFSDELNAMGDNIDFELVLPYAIKNFIPVGLLGLLVAGLLSAFMSTFAATVNAAPAYIVNDIYKKYFNPDAEPKVYIRMSYLFSAIVVIVGIGFGFLTESINSVTQWIVAALWGGYTASNVLKWYWWRFNGYGYFWGMVAGIFGAMFMPVVFPEISAINSFPIILLFSLIGCLLGSYMTPPNDDEVLKSFYIQVRPWGFWKPVYEKIIAEDPDFERNKDFWKDMWNIFVGIIWQTCLVAVPVYIIIGEYSSMWIGFGILLVTSFLLKIFWWDKLED